MAQHTSFHLEACPSNQSGNAEDCSCPHEARHYDRLAMISLAVFLVEIVGGKTAGSLALMSDAFHVLMDGTESIICSVVSRLVRKGKDERTLRKRGATLSASLLLFIGMGIAYEGYVRVLHPHKVEWYMIVAASIGLIANLYQGYLHGHALDEHRNAQHFWQKWHILSDALTSIAVIIAGLVMTLADTWYWLDGALSVVIGGLIMVFTSARLCGVELHSHAHDGHEHDHEHHKGTCCHHDHKH